MLINGKEVVLDLKKSQNIQSEINDNKNLPDFIKSEVSKKQLIDAGYNDDQDISNALSEVSSINNSFLGGSSDLDNRKNWYATFQEMSSSNFIHRALQVVCDDACQKNTEGNTVGIVSDNEENKTILSELFHKRLNLNKELWSIFYETVKLGDNFYEIIPDSYEKPTMIAKIRYLEPHKVNRIEVNNKLAFYTYTTEINDEVTKQKTSEIQYRLQPWQVVHFKIEDKDFYPYGGSLLKSGVRTYRRLSMLEDAILVYRLARTPERRVFKIGVGNLSSIEANRFVQRVRDNYRTSQIIDSEGKINRKAASLSITQDIFIPVREGESGTNVETLSGGQGLNTIEDLKFFRDEILLTLNIPPDYLGVQQDGGGSRGSLAVLDSKFARFVERIQYYIEEGLTKIAFIELFFAGKKKEELQDFKLELTPPSNIKEIIDLEFINQKMNLIQSMISLNIFPTKYILKNVLRLSNKEINDIMLFKELEEQKKAQAGGAAMGGDMGMPMSAGMSDVGGMPADMSGIPMDPQMPQAPQPEAENIPLNQENIINMFGKEFLLENKDDFFKLIKASKEYNEKKDIIVEEETFDNESLMEGIKKVLSNEKPKISKNNYLNLFYEGELDGLFYDSGKFITFSAPKKKTGKKVPGKSDIIYHEEVYYLNNKTKKKK